MHRPQDKEKERLGALKYYHRHKDKILSRRRGNPEYLKKHREYLAIWKKQHPGRIYELVYNWKGTASGIYSALKNRKPPIEIKFSRQEFIEWYNKQEQHCVYCRVTSEQARLLPKMNRRSMRLSIDRKDNDGVYSLDNICLCCYMCNTIKNSFLTYEEMLKIGEIVLCPKMKGLLHV